jgi:hypothetical protein
MAENPKFNRSRRSLFKAIGVTVGALAATSVPKKEAQAQWWCWWCGDGGTGGGGTGGGSTGGGVCFARGTAIRTAEGYRPVETLATGDLVAARFAGLSPIREVTGFTLHRTGPNGSWAGASRPVRVRAGALGENSPAYDLVLTASHAVFTDGVLVPVVNLVNGTSIVFETAADRETLDFFHIALARHDVLDAQGAACESWRDAAVEEPCVPMLSFYGGRDELRSRLRSAASIIVDRRQPLDIIRDSLEERGLDLARAA